MENELDKCTVVEGGETESAVPAAGRPKKKSLARRILKWVLWSVAGLFAFVLVAVLTLPLWINPVATSVAKSLVPKYTGTAFDIKDVELNPYTGKMLISGVELANPEGYSEKDAFKLGKITADVEMTTLLSKTIHVREVTVEDLFASYVFDAGGVNNFDRIVTAVNEKLGPKKEKKEEPSETKVVIDKVTVKNVAVAVGTGRFALASLTLTDFGRDDVPAKLEISDVKLVNPPGFEAENAFSLKSLSIGMETGDLGALPIKIHDVVIDSPYASYVFDDQKVDNFTRMLEPLLATGGKPGPEKKEMKAEKKAGSSGAPVTLDRLEVKNLVAQICKGRFELASLVVTDFGKPTAAMIKLVDAKLVNPEGFPEPNAFSLKSLSIGMETADLSKKPMVFHDIIVESPYAGVVLKKDSWDNNIKTMFGPLMDGGKKEKKEEKVAADEKKDEEKTDGDSSRVVIDKLEIKGLRLQFLRIPIKQPDIFPIRLTDIGKQSEKGATVMDIAEKVGDRVMEFVPGPVAGFVKKCYGYLANPNVNMKGVFDVDAMKVLGGATDVLGSAKGFIGGILPGGDKKDDDKKEDDKKGDDKKKEDNEPGLLDKTTDGAKGLLNKVNPVNLLK